MSEAPEDEREGSADSSEVSDALRKGFRKKSTKMREIEESRGEGEKNGKENGERGRVLRLHLTEEGKESHDLCRVAEKRKGAVPQRDGEGDERHRYHAREPEPEVGILSQKRSQKKGKGEGE